MNEPHSPQDRTQTPNCPHSHPASATLPSQLLPLPPGSDAPAKWGSTVVAPSHSYLCLSHFPWGAHPEHLGGWVTKSPRPASAGPVPPSWPPGVLAREQVAAGGFSGLPAPLLAANQKSPREVSGPPRGLAPCLFHPQAHLPMFAVASSRPARACPSEVPFQGDRSRLDSSPDL